MRWPEWVFKCYKCGTHIMTEKETECEGQKEAEAWGWTFEEDDLCDECSALRGAYELSNRV